MHESILAGGLLSCGLSVTGIGFAEKAVVGLLPNLGTYKVNVTQGTLDKAMAEVKRQLKERDVVPSIKDNECGGEADGPSAGAAHAVLPTRGPEPTSSPA